MKFNFSFFGKQEVRKFNYKPRFYDPEEEARREKFGHHQPSKETSYSPGKHLKNTFRDGKYSETKDMSKNQRVLGAISLLLLMALIYLLIQYFPKLMEALDGDKAQSEVVQEMDEYQIID